MISSACFVESELKLIFHCRSHLFTLERLLFDRLAESIMLWTTENSHLLSIKKQKLTLGKHSLWHLVVTYVGLSALFSVFYSSKNISWKWLALLISRWWNPSNALEISKKNTPDFVVIIKYLKISCAIYSKWLVKKSYGLNPTCFNDIRSFSKKKQTNGKHVVINLEL